MSKPFSQWQVWWKWKYVWAGIFLFIYSMTLAVWYWGGKLTSPFVAIGLGLHDILMLLMGVHLLNFRWRSWRGWSISFLYSAVLSFASSALLDAVKHHPYLDRDRIQMNLVASLVWAGVTVMVQRYLLRHQGR